jgi:hypothetical protein
MKRLFPVVGVLLLAVTVSSRAMAGDAYGAFKNGLLTAVPITSQCNPWIDYNCAPPKVLPPAMKCLDTYLGDNPAVRFFRNYELEWGKAVPPAEARQPR